MNTRNACKRCGIDVVPRRSGLTPLPLALCARCIIAGLAVGS
jgi:hypothetical protein